MLHEYREVAQGTAPLRVIDQPANRITVGGWRFPCDDVSFYTAHP
jgi:hypothetical protein